MNLEIFQGSLNSLMSTENDKKETTVHTIRTVSDKITSPNLRLETLEHPIKQSEGQPNLPLQSDRQKHGSFSC